MPHIKPMLYFWLLFPHVFLYGTMSICDKVWDCQIVVNSQEFQRSLKAFQLHGIRVFHLIALKYKKISIHWGSHNCCSTIKELEYPHRNKVQKRHSILYLFCTFYVPFDWKYKKGIPFMYPSDNLDNFPCTFCVPLLNLVIFWCTFIVPSKS